MSGVYGIFKASSNELQKNLCTLRKWNNAYGDGSYDEHIHESFGVGICPLHITNAPVISAPVIQTDNYCAVIDAIIYNRSELIDQYALTDTLSDEEMVFQLMTNNNYNVLALINGDFSGAILDKTSNEITLFTDHMGVRPLYYMESENFIAFSSDMRGLLPLSAEKPKVNPDWLYKKICGYDSASMVDTELKGIHIVRPASYLTIKTSKAKSYTLEENIYWKLGTKKVHLKNTAEYTNKLRELITDSVNRRLDVFPDKIGAELSGGLDSGVIDILISRHGREASFFSWSFSLESIPLVPNDERQVILDICEQEGTSCVFGADEVDFGPDTNVAKAHAKTGLKIDTTRNSDFYLAFPPTINTTIICKTAEVVQKDGCKVVFSGHSGDEGVSHRCGEFELFYHREYIPLVKQLFKIYKGQKYRLYKVTRNILHFVKHYKEIITKPFNDFCGVPEILNKSFNSQFNDAIMPPLAFHHNVVEYIYSGNTNVRLNVAALLGAYSGAQYIFPYCDYRVIDYAVSIPRHLYLNGKTNRFIFREAFKDMMPDSLYTVTAKNNPSTENMEFDHSRWTKQMENFKSFVVKNIDREYWKDYLDLDFIDNWSFPPSPTNEEKAFHMNAGRRLRECLMLQNMIKLVRELEE